MSSIIKSFAHKVHVLQQSWRRWKAMKDAKIRLWMLLWDQIESAARDDAVPEAARVTMLEEYLRSCKREIIKAKDLQETEMLEFVAKRGATEELKKPKDQRVPNLLTRKVTVMFQCMTTCTLTHLLSRRLSGSSTRHESEPLNPQQNNHSRLCLIA